MEWMEILNRCKIYCSADDYKDKDDNKADWRVTGGCDDNEDTKRFWSQ